VYEKELLSSVTDDWRPSQDCSHTRRVTQKEAWQRWHALSDKESGEILRAGRLRVDTYKGAFLVLLLSLNSDNRLYEDSLAGPAPPPEDPV
jgi:hypothetical protein